MSTELLPTFINLLYDNLSFPPSLAPLADAFLGVAAVSDCVVHITTGLVGVLLSMADDRDPQGVTVGLTVTPAADLDADPATDLDPETPVFTHFYHPDAGGSVRAVFGMDLASPRTQGRFVSHPDGDDRLRERDDFHEVVFVAVPPWEELVAYDRSGERLPVEVVDAVPPSESVV